MRAFLVVMMLATPVLADSKTKELATGYTKERVWYVGYQRDARRVRMGCRDGKAGSVVGRIDDPDGAKWQLEPVLAAMLAARDAK